MKELVRIIQISTLAGSIIFFIGAFFAYTYEESSHGMLPVITHPFREISPSFTFIALIFGILFIGSTIFYEIKVKSV
ncbi:MAG: hypothetical protein ACFE8U_16455 [Candidatus Hermodarchaeota archaeon]